MPPPDAFNLPPGVTLRDIDPPQEETFSASAEEEQTENETEDEEEK